MRPLSERTLHRYGLYGWPQKGPGADPDLFPPREAWPDLRLRIGTSGWAYAHWKGRFYPNPGLPATQQLAFLSRRLPTVEVNSTYYRLPPERVFASWREAVPPGFRFAIKAPGMITHEKRLVDVEEDVAEFLARCGVLQESLGIVLWQFPPGFHADLALLERLLDLLPREMRHAVELRHRSWYERDVYRALAQRNVAFVVHDYNQKGTPLATTAEHVYLRLHGPSGRYRGSYDAFDLFAWAQQVRAWLDEGREVWCYLNNDERGKAVRNGAQLRELVGEGASPAPPTRASVRGLGRAGAAR